MTDRVFITNADYPITIEVPLPKTYNTRIVPLLKIKETEDPITREPLVFPTEDTWIDLYNRLENLCVACCPNGHALSFQSFCRMMKDDDWDISNLSDIVKVKCPMCRIRYVVHETILTLAYTFNSLQGAIDPSREKVLKHVATYFSTVEDEDDEDDTGPSLLAYDGGDDDE